MADAGRFLEIECLTLPVAYDPAAGWKAVVTYLITSDRFEAVEEAVELAKDYADMHLGTITEENLNTPPEGR